MALIVEVVPDVSGIDRVFAYEVPASLIGRVRVGSIVRVGLHARRVRGWVVAEATRLPPEVELRPVEDVASHGPSPAVVELIFWAAWRYAGRLRPLLVSASPPRLVRVLPPRPPARPAAQRSEPDGIGPAPRDALELEIAMATRQALSAGRAVLRLPPAAPRLAVVQAALQAVRERPGTCSCSPLPVPTQRHSRAGWSALATPSPFILSGGPRPPPEGARWSGPARGPTWVSRPVVFRKCLRLDS